MNKTSILNYQQYSVEDFDSYDCLKLSKRFYLVLLFILRSYLVWLMSVTNMRDKVSFIAWVYPDTSLFYVSLFSGVLGLIVVLMINLRRPDAAQWVQIGWCYSRALLITALLFDLFIHILSYFYWQLFSINWLIIQLIITVVLTLLCYTSNRIKINLAEFPQKIAYK